MVLLMSLRRIREIALFREKRSLHSRQAVETQEVDIVPLQLFFETLPSGFSDKPGLLSDQRHQQAMTVAGLLPE